MLCVVQAESASCGEEDQMLEQAETWSRTRLFRRVAPLTRGQRSYRSGSAQLGLTGWICSFTVKRGRARMRAGENRPLARLLLGSPARRRPLQLGASAASHKLLFW